MRHAFVARRALFPAMVLMLSHAAFSQNVVVTPLPGPASCYNGTQGADHVMFLRGKASQTDCDVIGGGSPCLARREFAGDGPNGRPVSLLAAIVQRPSVTGVGDFVAFAEFGFNVCFMATASEDTEACLNRDLLGLDPHSMSFAPAGTAIAITQLDDFTFQPVNLVYVADPNTLVFLDPVHQVVAPGVGGNGLQVETVDFTVDGDFLIVDAFNTVTGLWGIYAIDRTTGATLTVVAPVVGLQIRNPALAQTSDDHMVFDAQDPVTFANTVYAANLRTGALGVVATTAVQGFPSYTGDDGAVVFNESDPAVVSLVSLDIQPVGPDRMTPVGARTRWLTDGGVPAVYRRGAWDGTLLDPSVCAPVVDTDSDGVADDMDNCQLAANGNQQDTNGDGIGNICDLDLNDDCTIDFLDLGIMKSRFFSNDPDADHNGDNIVDFLDLGAMKARFFGTPGPSGLPNACN